MEKNDVTKYSLCNSLILISNKKNIFQVEGEAINDVSEAEPSHPNLATTSQATIQVSIKRLCILS